MKKVLLIQNTISKYRVPIYNILSKKYEMDAICSYGDIPQDVDFEVRKIPTHDIWKLTVHNKSLFKIAQNYDVALGLFSPTWASISTLPVRAGRKYRFIPWGIGVPASYSVHYDDHAKSTKLIEWMIRKSDAVIFYSDYPVKKYASMGLDAKKMFVAHNTVQVLPLTNDSGKEKNTILFIGTLYKSKGIMSLLECYKRLVENYVPEIPLLRIVGGGDEFDVINRWISDNNLQPLVKLEGEIYDENILRDFFQKAIVCISPGQAGLSVQKSMGYGVPFITSTNAYTGGERLDIVNGVNGVLFNDDIDMYNTLVDICHNKERYITMGKNAFDFYHAERTVEMMAQGAVAAIEYALD